MTVAAGERRIRKPRFAVQDRAVFAGKEMCARTTERLLSDNSGQTRKLVHTPLCHREAQVVQNMQVQAIYARKVCRHGDDRNRRKKDERFALHIALSRARSNDEGLFST